MLVFSVCLFLFQLANASVLPLAGEALIQSHKQARRSFISALIIVPQILDRTDGTLGRTPGTKLGSAPASAYRVRSFAIRALGFALISDPLLLVGVQVLDGISATVLGVLTALVIADITSGTGRSIWRKASLERLPELALRLHDAVGSCGRRLGSGAGFSCIAATALLATIVVLLLMPETRPQTERTGGHLAERPVTNISSIMERIMAFKVQVGPPQISIHQDQTILISELDGQIKWPSEKGLFFRDTRVISSWTIYAMVNPGTCLMAAPSLTTPRQFSYQSRLFDGKWHDTGAYARPHYRSMDRWRRARGH